MLPDWIIKWFGGGILILISYVIISNTLWLIFGAKILQALPGVNISGARGTLKIIIMLLMSGLGIFVWIILLIPRGIKLLSWKSLKEDISASIKTGGKLFYKIFPNM